MKPKLAIVIPTFNQEKNLGFTLAALSIQDYLDFDVIVVDDGGSDNSVESCKKFSGSFRSIIYAWHEDRGFRAGEARNVGVKLLRPDVTGIIFIDSHILLNKYAITHYRNLHTASPDAIIAGRYDWLPSMKIKIDDIYHNFDKIVREKLKKIKEDKDLGIQGKDPRMVDNPKLFNASKLVSNYTTSLYSGNLLFPRKPFEDIGGFDEKIIGHGGEDCELGIRFKKVGYKAIFSDEVVGYHIWHSRNQKQNVRDVKRNIEYIAKKHNLDKNKISRIGDDRITTNSNNNPSL